MNEDILLAVFGTRKLAFADLPHLVIAEPTGAILDRWRLLTGAPLGIWGLGAPFSSASADEPDYEDVPLATWACERNQQALFDTIVRCSSEAGKAIIDCRLDEELVRAYLGDKLATLELREQWRAITKFVIDLKSWATIPLTIDTDYVLLMVSSDWTECLCDMASWCKHSGVQLYRVARRDGRPTFERCGAADVGKSGPPWSADNHCP